MGAKTTLPLLLALTKLRLSEIVLPSPFTAKKVLAPARLLFPIICAVARQFLSHPNLNTKPNPELLFLLLEEYFHPAGFSIHKE